MANLDLLKLDMKSYAEMLSDVALNKYAAHENIEIVDENDVRWLPSFIVKFKKEDGEPEKKRSMGQNDKKSNRQPVALMDEDALL